MLKDILKESWAFQEIAQEAREEESRKVQREVQREEEKMLFSFIQKHFPALMQLAEEQCKAIETPEQMEELLRKVILAQDEQGIRQHLLDVKKENA
jgi:fructose-1,6-bisphosphatase/inositol monophosphatase family enzyme